MFLLRQPEGLAFRLSQLSYGEFTRELVCDGTIVYGGSYDISSVYDW